MTDAKAFIDTNVLLRATHYDIALHEACKILVRDMRRDGYELWISQQIIREYLVQVSRPGMLTMTLTTSEIKDHVTTMRSVFKIAYETESVVDILLELIEEFPTRGKQIHDANIVATMLVYGIDTLLTINVDDMKRFAGRIKILSPAAES